MAFPSVAEIDAVNCGIALAADGNTFRGLWQYSAFFTAQLMHSYNEAIAIDYAIPFRVQPPVAGG